MLLSNSWNAALTLEQAIDRKFLTIAPNELITEAIAAMHQAQTSYILVVEQQRLLGIFTERDVVRLAASKMPLDGVAIAQVMTDELVTLPLTPTPGICSILSLLRQHQIRHLPLVDNQGQPRGVVTSHSIAQVLDRLVDNSYLEKLVEERTAELLLINARLREEIQERKQLEAQFLNCTAQLQAITDNAVDFIVRFDHQLRHLFVNRALTVAAGIPLSDYIGKTNEELGMSAQLCDYWNHQLQEVFETGQPKEIEFEFETVNGLRSFQSKIVPERREDGQVETLLAITRDITKHKQVEKGLLDSEARLQYLIANSPAIIFTCEAFGNYDATYISDNVTLYLGYKPQEFIDNPDFWASRLHPEDAPRIFANLPKVFEKGWHIHEYRLLHENGTYIWFSAHLRIVTDLEGNPKELVGCLFDISDRKQAEVTLLQSEEKFRQLAENIRDVFWMYEIATNQLLYVSPAYEQVWGRSSESLYADINNHLETVHPGDRQRIQVELMRQRQGYNTDLYYRIVRPDGEIRWIHDRGFSIRNASGQIYRFVGIAEDITERQQAEQALQESEEKLRQLAENIHEVFFIYPIDYSYLIYINPAYEKIWGRSCSTLYQQPSSWLEAVHPEDCDRLKEALRQQYEGEGFNLEYRIIRPDGALRWIFARTFILLNREGQAYRVIGVAEDVTERKQSELALRQLNQNLEAQVQERTAQLRTLIDAIPEYIFLINRDGMRIDYCNNLFAQNVCSAPRQQVEGKTIFESCSAAAAEYFAQQSRQVFESGQTLRVAETLTFPHGTCYFDTIKVPLVNSKGKVYALVGAARDITPLRQAEEALRESEEKFRQLTETINEVFFLVSVDGQQMLYISPAYEKVWGRTCSTLYEQPTSWLDAIHPDDRDRVFASFVREIQNREELQEQYRIVRPDGTIRWISNRTFFVLNELGQPYRIAGIARDITERKLAEQELEKNRLFIQRITDTSPSFLYIYDIVEQRNIYTNRNIGSILGYTPEDIQAMGSSLLITLMHPDDFVKHIEGLQRIQTAIDGEIWELEYRMRHANGSWRWIHSRYTVFTRTDDGAVKQILGAAEDISQRKLAETARRESEERFRAIFEQAAIGISRVSLSGQFLEVNQRFCDLTGYTEAELLERTFQELTHPDDLEPDLELVRQLSMGKIPAFSLEKRYIRKDGQLQWVNLTVSPVHDSDGATKYNIGVIEDISDRKQAEAKLRDSEHRFRAIFEQAAVGMSWVNVEGQFLEVNQRLCELTGYTKAELLERTFHGITYPDDLEANLELDRQLFAGEISSYSIEKRYIRKDGQLQWVNLTESLVRNSEGTIYNFAVIEDISARKRAQEQIRASLIEKEVLLREIHHRVKNNLNIIHSLLNMQARTIQDRAMKNVLLDSQKRLQTMALIHEQLYQSETLAKIDFAEYIHRLVSNLFAASTLNYHLIQVEIQAEPVALNLETAISSGLIINELVTNAFKHAFPSNRAGTIRVEFYQDSEEKLHLLISDNGIGLPPDLNLQRTASLGMRLVLILAQQLRATFDVVRSNGTRFHLTFSQIQ
jgi:PAS domain S-box-containing protein